MSKFALSAAGLAAAMLLLAAVALGAAPINGSYQDRTHHVGVIVVQNKVATPTIVCHGTRYYPVHGVIVRSGRFTYHGKAAVAHGHRPPAATKKTMTFTGDFVTRHLVTGTATVGSCAVSYSAKYVGKLR